MLRCYSRTYGKATGITITSAFPIPGPRIDDEQRYGLATGRPEGWPAVRIILARSEVICGRALSGSPELMREAMRRLEHRWEDQP